MLKVIYGLSGQLPQNVYCY